MPAKRDKLHTIDGRLFQARMWREYAQAWDDARIPWTEPKPPRQSEAAKRGYSLGWLEKVLKVSRAECIRRARVNLYLARRLNRR